MDRELQMHWMYEAYSGVWGSSNFFVYFSFSAENVGSFYFLLFFGPKMKLLFQYLFFGRKRKILLRSASIVRWYTCTVGITQWSHKLPPICFTCKGLKRCKMHHLHHWQRPHLSPARRKPLREALSVCSAYSSRNQTLLHHGKRKCWPYPNCQSGLHICNNGSLYSWLRPKS